MLPRPTSRAPKPKERLLCFSPYLRSPYNHVRSHHPVISSNKNDRDSNPTRAAPVPLTLRPRPSLPPPSFLYHLLACHFLFRCLSLSLVCKSKCSRSALFSLCSPVVAGIVYSRCVCDCTMMMIVLLILLPGLSSVAVKASLQWPGDVHTRSSCCFVFVRWCRFVLPGTAVYVIPSNTSIPSVPSQDVRCKCSVAPGTVKY